MKILLKVLFISSALFLQVTVLEVGNLWGINPDFLLVVLTWLALSSEIIWGIGYGFGLGFLQDVFSGGPMGLNALVKTIIGLLNGVLRKSIICNNPGNRLVVVMLNTVVQAILIIVITSFLSLPLSIDTIFDRGLLYQILSHGILSLPIMWAMDKADQLSYRQTTSRHYN